MLVAFGDQAGDKVVAEVADEGLDLWVVFGLPGGIQPDRAERFFVRTRPREG